MTLFFSSVLLAQIPTTGLVGHYDFSGGALTDNINSVSFTKAGTASTTITDRFGNANEAISLNGDDLLRPDIDFNVTNANPYLARTISFWVKTATNDGNVRLIYNDNDRTNVGAFNYKGLIVYLQNGQIKASNRVGSNGNLVTHSTSVNDNVWHHITIQAYSTLSVTTKRFYTYIYVDGIKEGGNGYQGSTGGLSVTANEHIGSLGFSRLKASSLSTNQKYQDGLDEVLFYTRVLTDAEVDDITLNGFCTVNIPDANFKAYLVGNALINTNGNTEIECNEASAFSGTMNCGNLSISDLTGIESFTALTSLYCDNNLLTTLDLSNNTSLTTLECRNNSISSLDVSQNNALEYLLLNNNSMTTLDVSQNNSLLWLRCNDNNLTNLDLSNNTNLTQLLCKNNALVSLNVSNTNNVNLLNLDALGNSSLTCIQHDSGFNPASNANWLKDATASWSTNCPPPCTVNIPDANFKANLVANTLINTNGDTEIQCSEASGFTGTIDCSNSTISDLTGIEAFTAITEFNCSNNPLNGLDLSQNTALIVLSCNDNTLTTLDVSQNTAITELHITENSLTSIDLSQNIALKELSCMYNDLESLDLSNNTVLTMYSLYNNNLSSLNVANGNNTNFTYFSANYNPNLTCIQVDDDVWSTTNWTLVGAQTSFSKNCSDSSSVGINDLAFENISVYPNPTNGIINLNVSEELSTIKIMDLTGKTIKVFNAEAKQLDISNFTAGIYFLEIANAERKSVVKIVKK